ncbi:MAG: amino acid decarboxylase [Ignavibacteriae bacterium HGW-Ignavibacteriae-2]|nr:MAG: amino acid decarboxylase [Ignavibacteriae bacterium HGW-Ignavibacteriae-2]
MVKMDSNNLNDMPNEEFRKFGHELIDWVADYLENVKDKPVLAQITPGEVKLKLPDTPPFKGEPMGNIIDDLNDIIMPGMTHWNHPRFMAYFNSTASGPGILAELISAAFNINGMNWKSCPAATELEEVVLHWLRKMIKLPENYWGIIYEGGSASNMHAIAAARENIENLQLRQKGMTGRNDIDRLRLYLTEHTHSSVAKGAINVGVGLEGIRKIPVDENYRMDVTELKKAIEQDRIEGWLPFCVVATVGTTSTTSIDPIENIADICEKENLWLHVDASHAGTAAIVPELNYIINGCDRADSFVVNPHKWMFMPIDISVFYTRKPEILKRAFSLVAEYLKTSEDSEVINYMDYGITLGRRFRSLKLWFVIRYFGVEGIIERLREHIRLGKLFEKLIDENPLFEKLAPVPLSTVCFRAIPMGKNEDELNEFNKSLMDTVNSTGRVFLSHTILKGKFTVRMVVSGIRTTESDVLEVWQLLNNRCREMIK